MLFDSLSLIRITTYFEQVYMNHSQLGKYKNDTNGITHLITNGTRDFVEDVWFRTAKLEQSFIG